MIYQLWFENETLDICASIEEAGKLLRDNRYDAVIIDLYLKDRESGIKVLKEIAQQEHKPPIIIVSAYIEQLREMFPIELEGVSWVPKEEATKERLMKELGLT